jgi:hypothetical protein
MGLNPETRIVEVILRLEFRKAPGISDYKAIQDYVRFSSPTVHPEKIRTYSTHFLGLNFGYLQLSPPMPKVKKSPKKVTPKRPKKRK